MASNTLGADVNEIHLAYLLNGNSFPDSQSQQQIERRSQALSEQVVGWQKGRAEAMYRRFLSFLSDKNYGSPIASYWTARPGFSFNSIMGMNVDQRLNPTDVLVRLSGTPQWYGISAKSTVSGSAGFKNPGVGTIDNYLGSNLKGIATDYVNQIVERFQLPTSAKARKLAINADLPTKRTIMSEYGSPCLSAMRDSYMTVLNNLPTERKVEFFATEWMNEDPNILRLPYVKITGSGTGPYSANLYDPIGSSKVRHLVAGPIILENVGVDAIGVRANNTKIFKMRFKFESTQLASSLKMSGDPW